LIISPTAARPEGSKIDPLHENYCEVCDACAAPIIAPMVSSTIAPLNIVFLLIRQAAIARGEKRNMIRERHRAQLVV
jgi:hypothetical protein